MRLDRLDLTRYGRFTDKSLVFAPPAENAPDLHIVYGPNEAGKSTLFSAWLDLLFGVPTRTRYDFLHPGPTMQIGAQVTHGGSVLDLKRMKRNNASLLDRHDAPLPETVLQSALGGLSRDGYSAMFSLDDETLEKGGASILASRGDLGEMLFSASAGLSGLAPQLEALRSNLDGFHRSGKRSGWLYDAKKELAGLDKDRRELEVSVGALQRLSRDATAAEENWREARSRQDALRQKLERLQDFQATFPRLEELARLDMQLQPLAHLPDVTEDQEAAFAQIDVEKRDLISRIGDRALRVQGLTDERAAIATDAAILGQSGAIAEAEALRPEHDTAIKDIPRRREEADEATSHVNAILAHLGAHDAKPTDVLLAGNRISSLRALLTARSGVQGTAASAIAESRKAAEALARERERIGDLGPANDEGVLAALLSRLRAQDPDDAVQRLQRDHDQARGKLDLALAGLAPWRGTADDLDALAVPTDWKIAHWENAIETARREIGDAGRTAEALRDEIARLTSESDARDAAQAATGVTLADAARARGHREATWAAHLNDLSRESAAAFEQALREDDRISSLMAEAIADARRSALEKSARQSLEERLADAENRHDAAAKTNLDTRSAIDAASATHGLHGAGIADLKAWLSRRIEALGQNTAFRDAAAALERGREALESARKALAEALGRKGDDASEPFDNLVAAATARVDASERRREARLRLAGLTSDLRAREQAETTAREALENWRKAWSEGVRNTSLAGYSDDDPELGEVLDQLERLGVEYQKAAALTVRIEKMEANRQRFATVRSAVQQSLGVDEATPWADVLARLRQAQDAARDHQTLTSLIEGEGHQDAADKRALAARTNDAAELGRAIGWDEGQRALADHISAGRKASALRQRIDLLRDELRDRPTPAEGQEAASIRQELDGLKAEEQILQDETDAAFTAHLEAKRKLEAVGGDDALARVAEARENLLLDIRERAEAHLAARFGLIAVETALRRYRDEHRSAMLTRASDAYRLISGGSYSGLDAQPDGAKEALVAIGAEGGAKMADDLSKGARYQLYLALRIAGYHELAQSRSMVPFIADDIMESFDDDRSRATFSLLADMSRVGQVIYLTHHRHLCDIAREVCPDANVIDLQTA